MNVVIAAVIAAVAGVALLVAARWLGGTAVRAFRVFVRGLWPH